MRLLAIDPGPKDSAYVIWDGKRILDKGIVSNDTLLLLFERDDFLETPDSCVIEHIKCYGMTVSESIFETVYWSGRFCQAWGNKGFFDLIPRMEVKMHLCHDSRARDSNIRQAIIDRLGEPGTKKNPGVTYGISKDVWQALALAVTAYDKNGSQASKSAPGSTILREDRA